MTRNIRKAIALFKDFRGENAEYIDTIDLPDYKEAIVVGYCDAIMYTTSRDGKIEKYIHKFKRKARPLLCASFDGKQLLLVGGSYDFTDRGIVDNT